MYRISSHVRHFALALLSGAALATVWVNLAPESYYDLLEWRLADLPLPFWMWRLPVSLTPGMIITDIGMAAFFFVIAKELWEAMVLERGALAGGRAGMPVGMTLGGMSGAALAWLTLQAMIETAAEAVPGGGWSVPLGTDTALAYLAGRIVFGRGHAALHLLMLLAITTDILALLVLGLSNPHLSVRLIWLLLPLAAAFGVWRLHGRRGAHGSSERDRRAALALWPYVLAGGLSWFGVAASGLPAALGLLPVVPAIAHAERSFGLFAQAEILLHDPLNRLAQILSQGLPVVLFLFGLLRGGIDLMAFAPTTLVTLGGLWIGRPLGMIAAALILSVGFGLRLPPGVRIGDLARCVVILAMGFTVPAVAIDAALPGGAMHEAARMGLAISLIAGAAAALMLRVPQGPPADGAGPQHSRIAPQATEIGAPPPLSSPTLR